MAKGNRSAADAARKIRDAAYPGWITSGSKNTVVFTAVEEKPE